MMGRSSLGGIALTTAAVAVTAACFLLLLPRARAFVTSPSVRGRRSKSPRGLSRLQCERRPDGMPILPSDVVKYTQVPKDKVFTATSIPSGLLKQHTTKKGTWGVIRVSRGQLEYSIAEPSESVHVLDSEHLGIIEPTRLHQVKALSDDVEFVVEFWRVPGTGAVDEKREGL